MARPAPDHLPIMPVGCWAVPLGLAGAAFLSGRMEEPSWWMLGLAIIFALFTLAYVDRAVAAKKSGGAVGPQRKRAILSGAIALLFTALYFIGR